jgi:DNA-directed RNA polymerase
MNNKNNKINGSVVVANIVNKKNNKGYHFTDGEDALNEYYDYLDDVNDKVQKQFEKQKSTIEETGDIYEANKLSKNLSNQTVGIVLIKTITPIIAQNLNEFIESFKDNKKYKAQKKRVEFLETSIQVENKAGDLVNKNLLNNHEISYIALKVILDNLYKEDKTISNIALAVFNAIYTSYKDKIIEIKAGGWHKKIKETTKTENLSMRIRMIDRSKKLLNLKELNELEIYEKPFKIQLGMLFISILVNNNIITRDVINERKKTKEMLIFTDEMNSKVENLHDIFKYSKVINKPMIIKPMPWVDILGGGYLNNELLEDVDNVDFDILTNKIARTRNKTGLKNLKNNNMDDVYKALNKIQNTPWVINKDLYELINNIWENNININKIPRHEPLPLPTVPNREDYINIINEEYEIHIKNLKKFEIEYEEFKKKTNEELFLLIDNKDIEKQVKKNKIEFDEMEKKYEEYKNFESSFDIAIKKYRKEASKIHTINNRSLGDKITFQTKLNIVKEFLNEEEIYFPHNLDFRGRIYPIPVLINPQGDDIVKSMLKFKEGKKLGKNGLKWLYIHATNVYGEDKISFLDRKKWVDNNINEIKEMVQSPLDSKLFKEADKPFSFLAVCIEIVELNKLENKEEFVSHIPVAMDGSCSGIQHYSAMLRDEIGGKGVNLIDGDIPDDIYKQVSNKVEEILKDIVKTGKTNIKRLKSPLLKSNSIMWLESGEINRGLTKRPVMTTPYGVKNFGMLEQIREYFDGRMSKGYKINEQLLSKESIVFITTIIDIAIQEVIVAARQGMKYIQDTLKLLLKDKEEIEEFKFISPLGFTITQDYKKQKTTKVNTFFGSVRYTFKVNKDDIKNDINKHINGIAPNFIHSLDATHLMKTVLSSSSTSFALIHDSFGVHASDTEELNKVLREEFYNLYKGDLLEDFINQIRNQGLINETTKPTYGSLNLESVKTSTYLFS